MKTTIFHLNEIGYTEECSKPRKCVKSTNKPHFHTQEAALSFYFAEKEKEREKSLIQHEPHLGPMADKTLIYDHKSDVPLIHEAIVKAQEKGATWKETKDDHLFVSSEGEVLVEIEKRSNCLDLLGLYHFCPAAAPASKQAHFDFWSNFGPRLSRSLREKIKTIEQDNQLGFWKENYVSFSFITAKKIGGKTKLILRLDKRTNKVLFSEDLR